VRLGVGLHRITTAGSPRLHPCPVTWENEPDTGWADGGCLELQEGNAT
jgi:hypothetical protein